MSLDGIANGRYTLGEFLGEGRFAVVYQAHDAQLQRSVAVKLLREEHIGGDPKWREAFDIEIDLLKELSGLPSVIDMTDHGVTSGERAYIGLELLAPGADLLSHVTHEGPFSEAEGIPIVWQLADLLRTAHARNIAYRDLKLEHIFWIDDRVILIDWNVSRRVGGDDDPLAQWEKEQSFHSDLFKLGTMLYSVFTGLDIRNRQVPTPVYSQLRKSGYELTDEGIVWPIDFGDVSLSPELEEIILGLVHVDLEERYQTAGEVCDVLAAHAERLGVELKPVEEDPPPGPQSPSTEPAPSLGDDVSKTGSSDGLKKSLGDRIRRWWNDLRS
jgi:serine/threonine protein kinase